MHKNAFSAGIPPRTPLRELIALSDTQLDWRAYRRKCSLLLRDGRGKGGRSEREWRVPIPISENPLSWNMFCLVRSSTYKNLLYQGRANPQLGWRQTYDLESFSRAFEDFCHSPSPCQRRMGIFNAREVTIIVHRQLFFFLIWRFFTTTCVSCGTILATFIATPPVSAASWDPYQLCGGALN